jgi:hypothetical protein
MLAMAGRERGKKRMGKEGENPGEAVITKTSLGIFNFHWCITVKMQQIWTYDHKQSITNSPAVLAVR